MFDPAIRVHPSAVVTQAKKIVESPVFTDLLKHAPNILMVLNQHRQVVYLNRNPLPAGQAATDDYLGERPGYCLACINITKGEFGCGSSEFCKVCGFNAAITASEAGKTGINECHVALKDGDALIMAVLARPFRFENENYVFCALEDISDKKRRQMLEGIFLHDILNTAAILEGLGETHGELSERKVKMMLHDLSANITDEVQWYQLISNVEDKTLQTSHSTVAVADIATEVVRFLRNTQAFRNRKVDLRMTEGKVVTERTLLRRVLTNMVKNALEASTDNEIVLVSAMYDESARKAIFTVKNEQAIPLHIQLRIFQKSFSTKGRGRGWGTYSIKILTEKYLKGEVAFHSTAKDGTTFTVSIPSLDDLA